MKQIMEKTPFHTFRLFGNEEENEQYISEENRKYTYTFTLENYFLEKHV